MFWVWFGLEGYLKMRMSQITNAASAKLAKKSLFLGIGRAVFALVGIPTVAMAVVGGVVFGVVVMKGEIQARAALLVGFLRHAEGVRLQAALGLGRVEQGKHTACIGWALFKTAGGINPYSMLADLRIQPGLAVADAHFGIVQVAGRIRARNGIDPIGWINGTVRHSAVTAVNIKAVGQVNGEGGRTNGKQNGGQKIFHVDSL